MAAYIKRRDFLTSLVAVMGGACSSTAVRALDQIPDLSGKEKMEALNERQAAIVCRIADIIIPETDTPGAAEARVHFFIDHMVANVMSSKKARWFKSSIETFHKENKDFVNKNGQKQHEVVAKLDADMWQEKPLSEFYRLFKELTIIGYYTSEIGATMELAFDPVPGPYRQVSISEFGRTWAS